MRNKSLYVTIALLSLLLLLEGCAGKSGRKSRFVDMGNGICQDTVTGTMWQRDHTKVMHSMDDARKYAANQTLGGHKDWRVPTVYELFDLNYLYDLHQGTGCPIEREGNYWSDVKDGDGMAGAWEIADQCDPERQYFPNGKGRVRLVRP